MKFVCLIFFYFILSLEALPFDSSKSNILPTSKYCGLQHSDDYHHSEKDTQSVEFPWVVYIPLQSRVNNPDADIRAAGVLISKRYVVINKSSLQFVLTKVYLGQHDTSKNVSCLDDEICEPVEEFGIEERVIDENKDIVLLRLDRDVKYTDNIRPICLPFDNFKKPEAGATVYTSGWGLTSYEGHNSAIKKKVKHTMISNEDCQKSGGIKNVNDETSICVKVQEDSPGKPCSGDEGSPIMYKSEHEQWILQGILSVVFDSTNKPCAIKDPARGSRITDEVLQWMVEKIHE